MLSDVPVGRGHIDLGLRASTRDGLAASVAAEWRPLVNLGLFGVGEWSPREARALLGARLTF